MASWRWKGVAVVEVVEGVVGVSIVVGFGFVFLAVVG